MDRPRSNTSPDPLPAARAAVPSAGSPPAYSRTDPRQPSPRPATAPPHGSSPVGIETDVSEILRHDRLLCVRLCHPRAVTRGNGPHGPVLSFDGARHSQTESVAPYG